MVGSLVPKPEPFSVTGTVSGNEARFIPQDGLLFRQGVLKLRSWNGLMLMCATVVYVQSVAVIINSI